MGTEVLVDSSILIDYLLGVPAARATLHTYAGESAISIVTWIEVLAGGPASDKDLAMRLLSEFNLIPLTPEIAEETVRVRRTSRLKLPDAVILATAHVEQRILITRNSRDFAAGPLVRIPYTL